MPAFGKLESFDPENDSWESYVERLAFYFTANEVEDATKKRAILLSVIGSKSYQVLRSLLLPKKPAEVSFNDIVERMKEYYCPKPHKTLARFKMRNCVQEEGQTVSVYLAMLRQASENCEYGSMLDDMIKDQLIFGVKDETLQKKLLEKDFTLKECVEKAVAHEAAQKGSATMRVQACEDTSTVFNLSRGRGRRQMKQEGHCWRCGATHSPDTCRFKNQTCFRCKKFGHIGRCCKSRQQELPKTEMNYVSQDFSEKTSGATVQTTDDGISTAYYCEYETIYHTSVESAYTCLMNIQGVDVPMDIDTGASCSVINQEVFKALERKVTLLPSQRKIKTFTGELVPIIGEAEVLVTHNMQQRKLRVVVTPTGPSLIGRDWLNKLKLNWGEIKQVQESTQCIENPATKLIAEYVDVFGTDLGCALGMKATLKMGNECQPKFMKARPVPFALKPKIEAELDRLEKEGIIEKVSHANWAAPIVSILKSDGTVRICGDYKSTVNPAAMVDQYPIPKVEDLLAVMSGGEKWSKLDLTAAYQQLELEESSKEFTVINTHKGLYRYNRLPFGVSAAPAIFQKFIEELIKSIPFTVARLDDILVSGKNNSEHLENLRAVFQRLREANVRLNKAKCTFFAESVVYCGNRIDKTGITPVLESVRAVVEAPEPNDVSQLKSYLGMLNYYNRFLPNISTLLEPLHHLLRKGVPWNWGTEQREAFLKSKECLTSADVLVHYDSMKPLVLSVDASPYGIGAVLSHVMEDDTERPIAFASRTLNAAERNYAQIDREGLAVVFGVKKFHQYIWGRHVDILTDHKPLLGVLGEKKSIPQMALPRVVRWGVILSAYYYSLKYRPGSRQGNSDGLSRLPLKECPDKVPSVPEAEVVFNLMDTYSSPVTASEIKKWTMKDPLLSQVSRYVRMGWPDRCPSEELRPFFNRKEELSVEDDCILWGHRVVIPKPGRVTILEELHETHPGVVRMKALARAYLWWPNLTKDIERWVRNCHSCQINARKPPHAELHPWEFPAQPWQRVHVDYAGPFLGRMFFVLADAYSKFVELRHVASASTMSTIACLMDIFKTHGLVQHIVSDNGSCFTSDEFKEFCSRNGIHHSTSAPVHPASNGLAERMVQTFKHSMKKMGEENDSLTNKLSRFQLKYNATPHATTGRSPAELLFHRRVTLRLDLLRPDVRQRVVSQQSKQKQQHGGTARNFSPGKSVYARNFSKGQAWLSGSVLSQTGPVSYEVQLNQGGIVRRHVDQVRVGPSESSFCEVSPRPSAYEAGPPPSSDTDDTDINKPETEFSEATSVPINSPTTVTAVSPVTASPVLRRSTRIKKPPEKLDL